jgi:lysozyme
MFVLSTKGIKLLQRLEGIKLQPYKDEGGNWTIATGHLIRPGEEYLLNGISKEKADELLLSDLTEVQNELHNSILVPLTQSQIDALYILVFNIGTSAFRKSRLKKLINNAAEPGDTLKQWAEHYITTGGHDSAGLKTRRAIEAVLYLLGGKNAPAATKTADTDKKAPLLLLLALGVGAAMLSNNKRT